jgi:hypothetical protein
LFRRETRTPGLTKNIPDICGNYGGYGAECKGGLLEPASMIPPRLSFHVILSEAQRNRRIADYFLAGVGIAAREGRKCSEILRQAQDDIIKRRAPRG